MPPVNDLPVTFPNSINAPGDVVRVPTDVTAQWDMCRWAKSRGGVLLADRHGPVYVAGGALAQTENTFDFTVAACEAWPLEELLQEERVALRALSAAATPISAAPPPGNAGPAVTLVGMSVARDTGRIDPYPVTMPSAGRAATFMEVNNLANTIVPLWAIMADPARGAGYAEMHDLRLRPFEVVYADRNGNYDTTMIVPYDVVGGWYVLRNYRLWLYAPVDALFEVAGTAVHVRPWNTTLEGGEVRGFTLTNDSDRTLERRLSFYINGQPAGSLDETAGVEVVSGLTEATTSPNQYNPNVISPAQPLHVRTIFRSRANAIHDICLAVFVAEGQRFQYAAHVRQPQLWARMVAPQPQFELANAGAAGVT